MLGSAERARKENDKTELFQDAVELFLVAVSGIGSARAGFAIDSALRHSS